MTDNISRRTILLRGLQIPVGGAFLLGLGGCGAGSDRATSAAQGGACGDPATLTAAEESLRNSVNYTATSQNAEQACAGCTFFRAAEPAGQCGKCDMFSGGAVDSGGHCSSWSAKS